MEYFIELVIKLHLKKCNLETLIRNTIFHEVYVKLQRNFISILILLLNINFIKN